MILSIWNYDDPDGNELWTVSPVKGSPEADRLLAEVPSAVSGLRNFPSPRSAEAWAKQWARDRGFRVTEVCSNPTGGTDIVLQTQTNS